MTVLDPVSVGRYAYGAGFRGTDVAIAIAVAGAESGFSTTAQNRNTNGSTDYGLWQINTVHSWITSQNWADPGVNAAAAYRVWKEAGGSWRPWVTFNTGAYKKFLTSAGSASLQAVAQGGLAGDIASQATGTADQYAGLAGAAADSTGNAITGLGNQLTKMWNAVASPRFWLRVGYVVIGGGLVIFAVNQTVTKQVLGSDLGKAVVGGTKTVTKKVVTKGAAK